MTKICIIGGGASGMMTAITIAQKNPNVELTIIEKKDRLGSKLAATGNGRCNISNVNCNGFGETAKFFRNIGIEIKVMEEGRAYPVSEQAKDVVKTMISMLKVYKINIISNTTVEAVEPDGNGGFDVVTNKNTMKFDKVVLAAGGKAAPMFGTIGDGYKIATKLGHTVNKVIPALVPVQCKNETLGYLKGVRVKGKATLYRKEFYCDEQEGEIQFTQDGLSGIAIFNMSSFIRIDDETQFSDYRLVLDSLNQYKDMEIFHILSIRRQIEGFKTIDLMNTIVHGQVCEKLLKGIGEEVPYAKDLTDEQLKEVISMFRNITFPIIGVKGWKEAQCTAGGISWDDFNWDTMESLKCKGLYFTGEVIDYCGPCGGFNLENAWSTARKAGNAICTELMK